MTPKGTFGDSVGRGPSGRLRNFGAMKSDKLRETYRRMLAERPHDPEAISACELELAKRVRAHRAEVQEYDEIGEILAALAAEPAVQVHDRPSYPPALHYLY